MSDALTSLAIGNAAKQLKRIADALERSHPAKGDDWKQRHPGSADLVECSEADLLARAERAERELAQALAADGDAYHEQVERLMRERDEAWQRLRDDPTDLEDAYNERDAARADADRMERERDEARETTAEAARGLLDLTEKLNAACADADRYLDALKLHGRHQDGCRWYLAGDCTCGLQAALDSASG